jgi:hypothetical protein
MTPYRLLVAALYAQVLLGLARFALPYLGFWVDDRVWLIHPVNGVAIAVAALLLFRPVPGAPAARARVAARFAPLLPLLLGFGLGVARDAIGSVAAVVVHMVAGIVAVRLIGAAMTAHDGPAARTGSGNAGRKVPA